MQLRDYQQKGVENLARVLASGKRKVVFQLATGGGKTITFSAIAQRFIAKGGGKVLILVHRKELLTQTRKTLYNAYGITAQPIVAGMRHVPDAQVYVGMVESTGKRLPKGVQLVIIDEAHISSFNKLHDLFPNSYIIGFTATPLSASKKNPMRNHYENIICGVDIPDLIQMGALCQNITYAPKDVVDRAALSVKGGEFDEAAMSQAFSNPRYVHNTISAYEKWLKGQKTIIFNCDIDHSLKVHTEFMAAGYNSRHLDSTMTQTERNNILSWFKHTPDAILNNVGILTAGFDEPSIEAVIFNRATMSMPLWLQCTGRGARPTETKSAFTIIDMGGNAVTHGDWSDSRDWYDIFHNPPKPGKGGDGVAPVKSCPQCEAILPAGVKVCKFCEYEFPTRQQEQEQELSEFVIVTKGIDVRAVIAQNRYRKEYFPFFKIGKDLAIEAKKTIPSMNNERADFILQKYLDLVRMWCAEKKKPFNQWHINTAREHLFTELEQRYKNWKHDHNQNKLLLAHS